MKRFVAIVTIWVTVVVLSFIVTGYCEDVVPLTLINDMLIDLKRIKRDKQKYRYGLVRSLSSAEQLPHHTGRTRRGQPPSGDSKC